MHKRDCTPSMRHKNICVSNLAGNEAQIRKKGECAQGGACPTVAQPSPCAGRCAEAHPMAGRFDGYPRSCRSGIHARRFFAVGHKWPTYARFVGWGLPHRRTTVAIPRTVRQGAPYGGAVWRVFGGVVGRAFMPDVFLLSAINGRPTRCSHGFGDNEMIEYSAATRFA